MLSLGLALLTLLAPPPQAPAGWVAVKSAEGTFTAEMPAQVKTLNREVPSDAGPVRQAVSYCKVDGAFYSIQEVSPAREIAPEGRPAALDREKAGFIGSNKGRLLREARIKADDHPGWDLTLEGGVANVSGVVTTRVRIVLAGQKFVIATVMSPPDRPLPDGAGRFFDGLKLAATTPDAPRPKPAEATPAGAEKALRSFLIALIVHDESTLRSVTLPADGFEALLLGDPLTPAQVIAARVGLSVQPIRALRPGDEVTIPGDRKLTVAPGEVADDRAILLPQGFPMPTRLRKVDGKWKVDAGPFIASRKAVVAAKARAEAKAKAADR